MTSESRVGLVTIATGRYSAFIPGLLQGAVSHLSGLTTAFVLSDQSPQPVAGLDVRWLRWGHQPWPLPTLLRHRALIAYSDQFQEVDVLLHIDADMQFRRAVHFEPEGLFAVAHPGYSNSPRQAFPYESDPSSAAYVPSERGHVYVAGGVQGGRTHAYLAACAVMSAWVQADLDKGIVPVWHDESIWNRYVVEHPDVQILPPLYCTPESAAEESSLIVALDKNHDAFREVPLWSRVQRQGARVARRLKRTFRGRVT